MDKKTLFIKAMQDKSYIKEAFRRRAFARTIEPEDHWKKDPFENRIVYLKDGAYAVLDGALTKVEGDEPGLPLYPYTERVDIPKDTFEYQDRDVNTSYYEIYLHHAVNIFALDGFLGYIDGKWNVSDIEDRMAANLVDTGKEAKGKVSVAQLELMQAILINLEGNAKNVIPAATPYNLYLPRRIKKKRDDIVKKYEGKLDDPLEGIKLVKELDQLDNDYLAEHPENRQSSSNARIKMFYGGGTSPSFTEEDSDRFITKPISEGLLESNEDLAYQFTISSYGSFARGKSTADTGTMAKILANMSVHLTISKNDCKTTRSKKTVISGKRYKGCYYLKGTVPTLITDDNIGDLIGKEVNIRTPAYCVGSESSPCRICSGETLYQWNAGVQISAMEIGNALLYYSFGQIKSKKRISYTFEYSSMIR